MFQHSSLKAASCRRNGEWLFASLGRRGLVVPSPHRRSDQVTSLSLLLCCSVCHRCTSCMYVYEGEAKLHTLCGYKQGTHWSVCFVRLNGTTKNHQKITFYLLYFICCLVFANIAPSLYSLSGTLNYHWSRSLLAFELGANFDWCKAYSANPAY